MFVLSILLIILIVFIDQILKWLILSNVKGFVDIIIIKDILKITYVENKGAAFGILENYTWLFIISNIAILLIFIYIVYKGYIKNDIMLISISLIVGGGLGNLIDRINYGFVIDYISLSFFPPVFNFADSCIVVGSILFILYIIFDNDNKRTKGEKNARLNKFKSR